MQLPTFARTIVGGILFAIALSAPARAATPAVPRLPRRMATLRSICTSPTG